MRLTFPVEIPKIEIPKVELEGNYVCWRFRWFKLYPEGRVPSSDLMWLYVDTNGNVTFGDIVFIEYVNGTFYYTAYIYSYDVNGNLIRLATYTQDQYTMAPYHNTCSWGQYTGLGLASSASYLVLSTTGSKFFVFRYGKKIWEWDMMYDGINKVITDVSISPNGKYIVFALGPDTYSVDSIVLYEGCTDSSLCPKPP